LGGRGVFTTEAIETGSLVEICPVLVIPSHDVANIHKTILHDYYFLWGDDEDQAVIALGYGSLYNHETMANATYEMDFEGECIEIYALRDIHPGEEITINYHGEQGKTDELWFEIKS
jgi:SET domain-containing protein